MGRSTPNRPARQLRWIPRFGLVAALPLILFVSPCIADPIVSRNLGSGAYSASAILGAGFEPEFAFDGTYGSSGSGWNSGAFPVQWVEVDLQQAYDLTRVRLQVDQN